MKLPILQALLVADHVYQDTTTRKFIVCGIFDRMYFRPEETPAEDSSADSTSSGDEPTKLRKVSIRELSTVGSPFAYISITDLQGDREFELRYVTLKDDAVLFGTRFRVKSDDPIQTIQLAMTLPPLPRKVGNDESTYALELLCENHLLGTFRITMTPQQPDEGES